MTFWRNIASLAARSVDAADCPDCPPGLPGEDPAFSTAVTALGAKLAKADGRPRREFDAFSEVFQPDAGSAQTCAGFMTWRGRPPSGSKATPGLARARGCPKLLEDVLDGLFHIAGVDGVVTAGELEYLERVCELFELSPLTFRRMKATHLGLAAGDPYAVLQVPADASDEVVHALGARPWSNPPRPGDRPRPAGGICRGRPGQGPGPQRRLRRGDPRAAGDGGCALNRRPRAPATGLANNAIDLRSTRDCRKMFKVMLAHEIRYFFYIGGNARRTPATS